MAEFVEVMRQFDRLCVASTCDTCCVNCGEVSCIEWQRIDPKEFERHVMEWAKAHPETVYPTWYEYLFDLRQEENEWPVDDHEFCKMLAETRIPADVAEKLAIKPKEAT